MNEFCEKLPMAAMAALRRRLEEAGDDDALSDSRLLTSWATGLTLAEILAASGPIGAEEAERLLMGAARRLGGEPTQYITGQAYFFGRSFFVAPGVLIPRRDTETLVAAALPRIGEGDRVLDVCCGSGCIGITLNLETGAEVFAGDLSDFACTVTEKNAKDLGASVEVRQGDLFTPFSGMAFDVITANPPYIGESEPLSELVKGHEPHLALFAGADGLDCYRRLIPAARDCLREGGYLYLEHGMGQSEAVCALLSLSGYNEIKTHRDMEDRLRVVSARKGRA